MTDACPLRIYYFLPPHYDYQQATLVEGLQALGHQVEGSFASNYCTAARPVSEWNDLGPYDQVWFAESQHTCVENLSGRRRTQTPLVCLDGDDYWRINAPMSLLPFHYFKRELVPDAAGALSGNVSPLGYAIESRYLPDEGSDMPWARRQIDVSCMMRLDTNPFRAVLQGALQELATKGDYRIHIGGTGEIAYRQDSAVPQPTPRYRQLLLDSRISISCHGVGQDTGRYWEILGAGAMLLSQRLSIENEHPLVDGQHCVYFDGVADFTEKLAHYLTHPEEAQAIASSGKSYAMRHHTTAARAQQVLDVMANREPPPWRLHDRWARLRINTANRWQRRFGPA